MDENDPALKDLMERMERTVEEAAEDHGYQVEGDRLVMTKGAPVVTVDWNAVKDNALSALQEAFEEAGSGPVEKRSPTSTPSTARCTPRPGTPPWTWRPWRSPTMWWASTLTWRP